MYFEIYYDMVDLFLSTIRDSCRRYPVSGSDGLKSHNLFSNDDLKIDVLMVHPGVNRRSRSPV